MNTKSMASKYATEIFWSENDDGYIAIAPDLPGCSAFGATKADAATEIEDAIGSWIEAAHAAGNPVPPPTGRNPLQEASGKTLLRMPKELHRDLQRKAQREGISLNSYICFLLTQRHYHASAISSVVRSLEWRTLSSAQRTSAEQAGYVIESMKNNWIVSTLDQKSERFSTPPSSIVIYSDA